MSSVVSAIVAVIGTLLGATAHVRCGPPLSTSIVTQLVTRPLDQPGPPCQRRTISLGMSVGGSVTSIVVGRGMLPCP